MALAPRGYAEDPDDAIAAVTAAVPTRPGDDNPLPFAITLASAAGLPSGCCRWCRPRTSPRPRAEECASSRSRAAEENLAVAARALPDAPEIESLVADGMTLESALKKLKWDDGDLLVVGSSRFAAPRRIFLGSTAARILAGVDAPVIVIPKDD